MHSVAPGNALIAQTFDPSNPSREYIRLGSRAIAIEQSSGIVLTGCSAVAGAPGWSACSIGNTDPANTVSSAGGDFNISAGGTGFWAGTADSFYFVCQTNPLVGDGTIFGRMLAGNANFGSQHGIMLRSGLGQADTFVFLGFYYNEFLEFSSRTAAGAAISSWLYWAPSPLPFFFKLVRTGNTVTAFTSPDAAVWTQAGSPLTITEPQLYAGMALSQFSSQSAATAEFDSIEVVPAGAGSAADFYLTTPAMIPAYSNSTSGTAQTTPLGISALQGFTGAVSFNISGLPAGVSATLSSPTVSGSGQTYLSLTIPPGLAAGSYPFAITATSGTLSHTDSPVLNVDPSHFAGLSGWLAVPIGNTDPANTVAWAGGNFNISAGGTGFWGDTSDSFYFVFQANPLIGDGTIYGRLLGDDNSYNTYHGIMLRSGIGPQDAFAFAGYLDNEFLYPGNRLSAGAVSSSSLVWTPSPLPLFFKLVRAGNVITAFTSADAATWTQGGDPVSISAPQFYAGFAVAGTSASASFAAFELAPAGSSVNVSLAPASVWLEPNQTQQFTASVLNTSNTGVTWSLSPNVGNITTAGLYTAPASVAAQQTITLTATSQADNYSVAQASITLTPPITVSVSPTTVSLRQSQTQQFSASLTNTNNTAVTWSLSPNVGSISSAGLYSAPATVGTQQIVLVTATSAADPAKSGSAAVTLNPTNSSSLPESAHPYPNSYDHTWSYTVPGNPSTLNVTFDGQTRTEQYFDFIYVMDGSGNNIAGSPFSGTALSGQTLVVNGDTVQIRLTSDGSVNYWGFATSVTGNWGATVSPNATSLYQAQTMQFSAAIGGNPGAGVTWSVNPNVGTIASSGLYTAPASVTAQQLITVTATGVADPTKSASAALMLNPGNLPESAHPYLDNTYQNWTYTVAGNPTSINVTFDAQTRTEQSFDFIYVMDGSGNNVTGSPFSGTTLDGQTLAITGDTVRIRLTSDGSLDYWGFRLNSVTGNWGTTLSPNSASLYQAQTRQFSAAIAGNAGANVTWTVNPGIGTITSAGLYTAPASIGAQQLVTVTATGVADATKNGSAELTLNPGNFPESAHPYANGGDTRWTYSLPGSTSLNVTFDAQTQTERYFDFLYVTDGGGNNITGSPFSGTALAGQTVTVPGDTVTLRLTSDGSVNYWGFAVTGVTGNGGGQGGMARSPRTEAAGKSAVAPLSPASVTLGPGETHQFTAAGPDADAAVTNAGVTWSLSPKVGTVTAEGLYTAPSTIAAAQTVTLTAVNPAGQTRSAIITLTPVMVVLTPAVSTLHESQTQQLTANVKGQSNTAVTWSLMPNVGTVSGSGLYTAPAQIGTLKTVVVKATSQADATRSAQATITLTPAVSIGVAPAVVQLGPGGTKQFTARVRSNGSAAAVTWTVSPSVGTITADGLYTAPATIAAAQTVTVLAASQADSSVQAAASITLTPAVAVSVSPNSVSLGQGKTQQFTATVTGTGNGSVKWSLSPGVGTISAGGLYTAPAKITAAQTVTLTAASVADGTKKAQAAITLTPAVTVGVTPKMATLGPGATQQFAAVASDAGGVAGWTLSPNVGTVTAGGLYTAPAVVDQQQIVTLTAASQTDSTRKGVAAIVLTPGAKLVVLPAKVALKAGQTQQFAAAVENAGSAAVTWSVSPNVGSVTASGLYTTPAKIGAAQVVTVTATSVADGTQKGQAVVALAP